MLDSLTDKQRKIVIIVGVAVAIIIMGFIYQKAGSKQILVQDDNTMLIQDSDKLNQSNDRLSKSDKEEEEQIVVHIAGEVKYPGIVKLKEGERIEDAIEKAGGLTENAEINNVNLAYVLEDGVKIIIPRKDSEIDEKIINEDAGKGVILENSYEDNKIMININKATEEELEKLSGVGASLASKIIDYRNKNGKFSSIEDIKNVSGIGESKFNSIRDFICVK